MKKANYIALNWRIILIQKLDKSSYLFVFAVLLIILGMNFVYLKLFKYAKINIILYILSFFKIYR